MTAPGDPGDTRMLEPPLEASYYGDPTAHFGDPAPALQPSPASVPYYDQPQWQQPQPQSQSQSQSQLQPQPVLSLGDPKVVLALAGLALLIGFGSAALLFGVILGSDDSESISSTADPSVAAQTQGLAAADAVAGEAFTGVEEGPASPNADVGSLVVTGADDEPMTDDAAVDSTMIDSTTSVTVATTVAPTAPPTTPAPTTAAPATEAETTTTMVQPPPAPSGGDATIQQQVLELTNAERARAGCPAVTLDPTLNAVADDHSEDMAANGYFDHTGLNGSQPWDRVQAAGYPARGSGENIAQGYSSPSAVVDGWMASSGHRRNILNCSWTELGVGYAEGGGSQGNIRPLYWTQVFATRG